MTPTGGPNTGAARRRALVIVAASVLGVFVVAAAAFLMTGGRFFVVRTPSMGSHAPVGSLVLTRPVQFDDLHVGDVVAYVPPTEPGTTFTHRIVAVHDGWIQTRGDINGATDPWHLTASDVVGRAQHVFWGLGWLVRALPLLLIGGLLVWGLTRVWASPERRGPFRVLGFSLVFALASLLLRPWIGVAQLATTSDATGTSRISVVSTGLLPVQLRPLHGTGTADTVHLAHAGSRGTSVLTHGQAGHQYRLTSHLDLGFWGWVVLIVLCSAPLLWTLLVGYRPAPVRHTGPARHRAAQVVPA